MKKIHQREEVVEVEKGENKREKRRKRKGTCIRKIIKHYLYSTSKHISPDALQHKRKYLIIDCIVLN